MLDITLSYELTHFVALVFEVCVCLTFLSVWKQRTTWDKDPDPEILVLLLRIVWIMQYHRILPDENKRGINPLELFLSFLTLHCEDSEKRNDKPECSQVAQGCVCHERGAPTCGRLTHTCWLYESKECGGVRVGGVRARALFFTEMTALWAMAGRSADLLGLMANCQLNWASPQRRRVHNKCLTTFQQWHETVVSAPVIHRRQERIPKT